MEAPRTPLPRLVAGWLAIALLGCGGSEPTADLILRGGSVVDGSGRSAVRADVAVTDGRVSAVGALDDLRGVEEVDVSGLTVAPGFMNLHSHDDLDGLPDAANLLVQGVTTVILNADGGGPVDLDAQLRRAEDGGLAVNVGGNIGFNAVWAEVNGAEDRRPDADRIRAMTALLERGLEAGAWGVSSGLDYKPAYFARTDEVVEVLDGLGRWRTVFTNHDRLVPETGFSSMLGMQETVEIGSETGLVPLVTHMKIQGHEQGTAEEVLEMMRRAGEEGVYTAADAYPYVAGQTRLSALIIPGWAQAGGREAMLERFADPDDRSRIVVEAEDAITARFGSADNVMFPASGATLTDRMAEMELTSPGEAVVRVLEADDPSVILRFGSRDDLVAILRHPTTSVACDCDAAVGAVGHPRYYGTFPRVLGRFVRDEGVMELEEAVRKMSGLPAATVGMVDRGFLAPGMAADLVVFDPETILDHATYEDPTAEPEGVVHVLVNGAWALRDGAVTGAQGGRVLRRSPSMPARPLELDTPRSVSWTGEVDGVGASEVADVSVEVGVEQAASDPFARGRLRLTVDGRLLTAERLGLLQVHGSWAGLTAWVRDEAGRGRAVRLILDGEDPRAGSTDGWSLELTIDGVADLRLIPVAGEPHIEGPL